MQYYRDGFYPGDPAISPEQVVDRVVDDGLVEKVDVLIVGSGPAGNVLAAQLAQFPDIRTRLIERRTGPLELGQADGIACRTVEMFQAFGFARALMEEAYWVNQTAFWRPDPARRERIVRTGRVPDVEDGLSEMPHLIMNQARVHDHLLTAARKGPARLVPEYGLEFVGLDVADKGDHPVTVRLRRVGPDSEVDLDEVVFRARFVVGTDGARSKVRSAIGRSLSGERANHAWGVLDILATTDFPDIRCKAAIQSDEHGSILLIPREGGYLVRLYVDLGAVTEENRDSVRALSAQEVVAIANRVLHPYTLDVKETVWFAVYEVAQRIADGFDDAAGRDLGRGPRVFIAGDACHTHSAKAGQGMNVSMQDAFNLGWKLAAVLRGLSDASLLDTFDAERRPVAQDLIDFDKEWSALIAAPVRDGDREQPGRGGAADPVDLSDYFIRQGRYTAGLATRYRDSRLTATNEHQSLATGLTVGMRFHSAPVIRVSDGKRLHLGHAATADGRWRMYAFSDASQRRFREFGDWLGEAGKSCLVPHDTDHSFHAVIDLRGIVQQAHSQIDLLGMPEVFRPRTGRLGLVDYEKVFAADTSQDIFDLRGIDRGQGVLVVVRPDQYVALVLPLDAHHRLTAFFNGIFVRGEAEGSLT